MTFTVNHYNFGSHRDFDTLDAAKAFTIKACFDAVITRDGHRVAHFTSTGGWRDTSHRAYIND
jgi:hypothetical protein